MKINERKTKKLICSKRASTADVTIENEKLKTVQSFIYLGSEITWWKKSRIA